MPQKPKLKECDVVFNEDLHTYTLNGTELSGVTALLHRTLFRDMYSGISKEVLDKAARRGTFVHKLVENFHTEDVNFGDIELEEYINTAGDLADCWLASEYLVSDRKRYASKIDLVYYQDKRFILADIKTVSKLDTSYIDYCSWQLSIYAYLFERQNPRRAVSRLCVIWLPKSGKPKLVDVERKSDTEIENLFAADEQGTLLEYNSEVVTLPVKAEREAEITSVVFRIAQLQKVYDGIKRELLELMQRENLLEARIGSMRLTRKAAYEREGIDTKKLKEREPLIAEKYKKTTKVAESLLIKID